MIGNTIGPYRIVSEIRRGGLATTYKAVDDRQDRTVALKVLPSSYEHDREFVARFQLEALSSAKLSHPNIVKIYDAAQDEGLTYIAMEYIEGQSLDRLLADRSGPLDGQTAVSIISQIAAALDYAHQAGLVHRDVKPNNILVDPEGRAVLTDFGISRAITSRRLTTTGALIGTPEYMSPEEIEGRMVDARSDIYSLGLVAYCLLTGRAPFTATQPEPILYAHVHRQPPPLTELNPALPKSMETAVLRALEKNPDRRYGTAGEFATALQQAGGAISETHPSDLNLLLQLLDENAPTGGLGRLLRAGREREKARQRQNAAAALGGVDDPRAVDTLIGLLEDPATKVRLAAAEALGRIGDTQALEPLTELLFAGNDDPEVLEAVSAALEAIDSSLDTGRILAGDQTVAPKPEEPQAPRGSGSGLAPGDLLAGRYEIQDIVDEGGLSTSYRARDVRMERAVIVKVAGQGLVLDRFPERLSAECQAFARLFHPNLVQLLDFATEPQGSYMIRNPVGEERSLRDLLAEQDHLSPDEALPILTQIGQALDYVHGEGIIHRHLKPSHILLERMDEGRHAVLLDACLTRALERSGTESLVGTPGYMSPEVVRGEQASPATDVYGLGLVAYEMLAGRPPFEGMEPFEVMGAHASQEPPTPREFNPELSEAVSAVILRALAKDPGERYANAGAFVEALEQAFASPTAARTVRIGLHGRNDVDFAGHDYEVVRRVGIEALTMLSTTEPGVYERLRKEHPDLQFIVRLFDDRFGRGTRPSPEEFVDRQVPVMERLRPYASRFVIHNEPNHTDGIEGWGSGDAEAKDFGRWYQQTLGLLRLACPWAKFGFPALAPGTIHRDLDWLEVCRTAVEASDWLACHCYWQGENHRHIDWGQRFRQVHERFPDKRMAITEFGDATPSLPAETLADRYVQYYQALYEYDYLDAACAFLSSSPDPVWAAYAWAGQDGELRPVVGAVAAMARPPLVQVREAAPAMPPYVFGMHDPGDWQELFEEAGKIGWVMFRQVVDEEAAQSGNPELASWAEDGYGVLVRLLYDHPGVENGGSVPSPDEYDAFARRCAEFVGRSPGCGVWFVGNEVNLEANWPAGPDGKREPVTPQQYTDCYQRVRRAIKEVQPLAWVIPSGLNPLRRPGEAIMHALDWFRDMLDQIKELDGLDIHTYFSMADGWGELQTYTFDSFLQTVPERLRHLPVFVSEATPPEAWPEPSDGWMQRTYAEINRWNRNPANQKILALVPYRWQGTWASGRPDYWNLAGKQSYREDLQAVLQYDYRWYVDVEELAGPSLKRAEAVARIHLVSRSLFEIEADALVAPTSSAVMLTGSIAQALERYLPATVIAQVRAVDRLEPNEALVSEAGELPVRHIIYTPVHVQALGRAMETALKLADRLGDVEHIAFPAVGTGVAGIGTSEAAEIVLPAVVEYLEKGSRLQQITFAFTDDEKLQIFADALRSLEPQVWFVTANPARYDWDRAFHAGSEQWTGVRGAEAQANLRRARPGDVVLAYRSSPDRYVTGLGHIAAEPYEYEDRHAVQIDMDLKLKQGISLDELRRATPDLQHATRPRPLSFSPVTAVQWDTIRELMLEQNPDLDPAELPPRHGDEPAEAPTLPTQFLTFEINLVRTRRPAEIIARVESPGGQAQARLPLDLDAEELVEGVKALREGMAPRTGTEALGRWLYDRLFVDEIAPLWATGRATAQEQEAGIRILLHAEQPELAALPWELMHDGQAFLALQHDVAFVRQSLLPSAPQPLERAGPLRILAASASPTDLPALDLEASLQTVQDNLGDLLDTGRASLAVLRQATASTLAEALREDHSVFHFDGHGSFDPQTQSFSLALEDGEGRASPLAAQQLARLMQDLGLQIVVLNTDASATVGRSTEAQSAAQALVRAGVPAVVAMQLQISDDAAIAFNRGFYGALAAGLPLDVAVAEARRAMVGVESGWEDSVWWTAPLFLSRVPIPRLRLGRRVWFATVDPAAYDWDGAFAIRRIEWADVREGISQEHLRRVRPGDAVLAYRTAPDHSLAGLGYVAGEPYEVEGRPAAQLDLDLRLEQGIPLADLQRAAPDLEEIAAPEPLSFSPVTPAQWAALRELVLYHNPGLDTEGLPPVTVPHQHRIEIVSVATPTGGVTGEQVQASLRLQNRGNLTWRAGSQIVAECHWVRVPEDGTLPSGEPAPDAETDDGPGAVWQWLIELNEDVPPGGVLFLEDSPGQVPQQAGRYEARWQVRGLQWEPPVEAVAAMREVEITAARFSPDLQEALRCAEAFRRAAAAEEIYTEHLLAALYQQEDGPVRSLLTLFEDEEDVEPWLEQIANSWTSTSVQLADIRPVSALPDPLPLSENGREALRQAEALAKEQEAQRATPWHLAAGLLAAAEGVAGHRLAERVRVERETLYRLLAGATDEQLPVRDIFYASNRRPERLEGHTAAITSLAFGFEGLWLISGSDDATVRDWNLLRGAAIGSPMQTKSPVRSAFQTPDGVRRIIAMADGSLQEVGLDGDTTTIRPADRGDVAQIAKGAPPPTLATTPDGQWLATAWPGGALSARNLSTDEQLELVHSLPGPVAALAIGQQYLATASGLAVNVWSWPGGPEMFQLLGHEDHVAALAFADDGGFLVSGSQDTTLKVWDLAIGDELHTLRGHQTAVTTVVTVPDRPWAVSGSADATLRVWDLEAGRELAVLPAHEGGVTALALSPDGRLLASGGAGGDIRLWDLEAVAVELPQPVSRAEALPRIKLAVAELLDLDVDAIVHPSDPNLMFDGAIGRQIRDQLGDALDELLPDPRAVRLGEALVTDAPLLPARYLIHTPVRDSGVVTAETASMGVAAALTNAEGQEDLYTLGLPSVGTLTAGLAPAQTAPQVLETILAHLERGSRLQEVTITFARAEDFFAYATAYEALGGTIKVPDWLARLSESSRSALALAENLRQYLGHYLIHNEHLLWALYQQDGGAARELLTTVAGHEQIVDGLQDLVGTSDPIPALEPVPADALRLLPLATESQQALAEAAELAGDAPSVRERQVLAGLLAVPESEAARWLVETVGLPLDELYDLVAVGGEEEPPESLAEAIGAARRLAGGLPQPVSREEALARLTFTQVDFLELGADAYVNSTSSRLSLGNTGQKIAAVLGPSFEPELREQAPVAVGDVVVSEVEGLPARYLLHVPIYDARLTVQPTEESVIEAVRAALRRAEELPDVHKLVIPSIATTWGNEFPLRVAPAIVQAVLEHLEQGSRLEQVTFANPLPLIHDTYVQAYASLGGQSRIPEWYARLSPTAVRALERAEHLRHHRGDGQLDSRHLLWGLYRLAYGTARELLTNVASGEQISERLLDWLAAPANLDLLPSVKAAPARLSLTPNCQQALAEAAELAGDAPSIRERQVLAGLLAVPGSEAAQWLVETVGLPAGELYDLVAVHGEEEPAEPLAEAVGAVLRHAAEVPVWVVATAGDDTGQLAQLEALAAGETITWGANRHIRQGDMILVYRTAPLSDIKYVFRAASTATEATPAPGTPWAVTCRLEGKVTLDTPVTLEDLQATIGRENWEPLGNPQAWNERPTDAKADGVWPSLRDLVLLRTPAQHPDLMDRFPQDWPRAAVEDWYLSLDAPPEAELRIGQECAFALSISPFDREDSRLLRVPHSVRELALFVDAPGFGLVGERVHNIRVRNGRPEEHQQKLEFKLVPLLSGRHRVKVLAYRDTGHARLRLVSVPSRPVQVVAHEQTIDIRELIDPRAIPQPQPDVMLYVALEETLKGQQTAVYVHCPALNWSRVRAATLPWGAGDLAAMRQTAIEVAAAASDCPPAQGLTSLRNLGATVYDQLMPPGSRLREFYQHVSSAARASRRPLTWLVVADEGALLPWELAAPYGPDHVDDFLGASFVLANWVGLQDFGLSDQAPLHLLDLTHYHQLTTAELERWKAALGGSDLVELERERGRLALMEPGSPFYGLHVLRYTERHATRDIASATGQGTQPAPAQDKTVDMLSQRRRLDFKRRQPVVGLSLVQGQPLDPGFNQRDSHLEQEWIVPLIHAGATALVGPRWPVSRQADQVFYHAFYAAMRQGVLLGEAVRRARSQVRFAFPHRSDWLAYAYFGHPGCKPYLVEASEGFAVIEVSNHPQDVPLRAGEPYEFRASYLAEAPSWYDGRRHIERPWLVLKDPSVKATVLDTGESRLVPLVALANGAGYEQFFDLTMPSYATTLPVIVRFQSEGRELETLILNLDVVEEE